MFKVIIILLLVLFKFTYPSYSILQFIVLALAVFAVAQADKDLKTDESVYLRYAVPAVAPLAAVAAVPAEDTGKWDGCHWDGRFYDCSRLGERFAPKAGFVPLPLTVPAARFYGYDTLGRRCVDGLCFY